MMGYVYILKLANDKTYTGSTGNLKRRIRDHTNGKAYSTKNKLPIELIYCEKFDLLQEARSKERYYKSCSGRKKIKEKLKLEKNK